MLSIRNNLSAGTQNVTGAYVIIKTHSSRLQGQEEAGLCDEPGNYLQVAPL